MAKHRAHETDEEMLSDELAAEAIAMALREYAKDSRSLADGARNCMEFTAASYHDDNAKIADDMAAIFETMRVDLWHTRRGVAA